MTSGISWTDAALGRHYFAPIRGLDHFVRRSQGVALGFCMSPLSRLQNSGLPLVIMAIFCISPFLGSRGDGVASSEGFWISPLQVYRFESL
jgi:hypothetical protein